MRALNVRLLALSRLVVPVLVLAYAMARTTGGLGSLALYTVSTAFFLASGTLLVGWIPSPMHWRKALLLLELALITLLVWFEPRHGATWVTPILYGVLGPTGPLILNRPLWYPFLGALLASWLLAGVLVHLDSPDLLFAALANGASLVVSTVVGMLIRTLWDGKVHTEELVRHLAQSQLALERAHRQLKETAARQQATAVLEERQRMAREIHDSVAHNLTALIVQIEAGRRLLGRTPEQAAATFERCEFLARDALQETRRAVRALHAASPPDETEITALERLGREFAAATGIAVAVTADEAVRQLASDTARLEQLYRIFQESLTNAHRHGKAHRVTAELTLSAGALCLTIANDGGPPTDLTPGLGLLSMAERAGSLGGSVRFTPGKTDGDPGLTIHVAIPLAREGAE